MRGVLTLLSILFLTSASRADSSSECKEWGFSGPACSDCDSLGSFVQNDDELLEQCKQCCVQDALPAYSSATFVVCPQRLGAWPELKNFIDKKASSYKKVLKIKYVYNSYPTLKLKHEGGTDSLRIDGWKTSQLEEFLKERVKSAAA